MPKHFLTYQDIVRNGSCLSGVIQACNHAGLYFGTIEECEKAFPNDVGEIRKSAELDGNGKGNGGGGAHGGGYGGGYGDGDGYGGHGNGEGYGEAYGLDHGYGDGYGYGYGNYGGYGYGECYGYGNGDGGFTIAPQTYQ